MNFERITLELKIHKPKLKLVQKTRGLRFTNQHVTSLYEKFE
jgi:hypothetical protein